MDLQQLQSNATNAETLLKAMANRHRLMILCTLLRQERDVNSLADEVCLSQSAVSQHLKVLRDANVLGARKDGVKVIYSIVDPLVGAILSNLYLAYCGPQSNC